MLEGLPPIKPGGMRSTTDGFDALHADAVEMKGELDATLPMTIENHKYIIPSLYPSYAWISFEKRPLFRNDGEPAYQRMVSDVIHDVARYLNLEVYVEDTLNVDGKISDLYFFTTHGRLIGSLEVKRSAAKSGNGKKTDADLVLHPKALGQLTEYMVEVLIMGGLRHSFAIFTTYQSWVLCYLKGSLDDNGLDSGVSEEALLSVTRLVKDSNGLVVNPGSWGTLQLCHSPVVDITEDNGRKVVDLVGTALRLMLGAAQKGWFDRDGPRPVITHSNEEGVKITSRYSPDDLVISSKLPHGNSKHFHRLSQLGRGLHGTVWKVAPAGEKNTHFYAAKYFHRRVGEEETDRNARANKEIEIWKKVNPDLPVSSVSLWNKPVLLMPFLTMLQGRPDNQKDLAEVRVLLDRCAKAGIAHDDLNWQHVGFIDTSDGRQFALIDFGKVKQGSQERALSEMLVALQLDVGDELQV